MELSEANKEHVRAWVAALRSGNYEQTTNKLKSDMGHCCLGVACEVFALQTKRGKWVDDPNRGRLTFRIEPTQEELDETKINPNHHLWEDHMVLPIPVANWLFGDWQEQNPEANFVHDSEDGTCSHGLAEENDDGLMFPEIADAIERTWL